MWLWLTASDDLGGSGVARTEYKLDAGDWTAGASCTVPAPADHSGDGEHTVAYRSVDAAGNVEPAKTVTVWIDTVRPAVAAPKAAKAKRGAKATLRYKVTDAVPNSGKAVVVIQVKNAKGKLVKTLKLGQRPVTNALQSAAFTVPKKWPRGSYRFSVYATDAAGNKQLKVASNRLIVR